MEDKREFHVSLLVVGALFAGWGYFGSTGVFFVAIITAIIVVVAMIIAKRRRFRTPSQRVHVRDEWK
jgi:uncharacterized membrane protein